MQHIQTDDFLEFARTLEGKSIRTRTGRARFVVHVLEKGLEFTPLSTMKPRIHTRRYIERVLEQFERTASDLNSDYRFTVNASYMLTLINLYLHQKGKQDQA